MAILESAENYLETILLLKKQNGVVRSIDIAVELNFSKPSVSVAMKNLKQSGLITIAPNGHIDLTSEGQAIAEKVYEKHDIISKILMHLGVSESQALIDACKIEHDLSEESFTAIKNFAISKIKL